MFIGIYNRSRMSVYSVMCFFMRNDGKYREKQAPICFLTSQKCSTSQTRKEIILVLFDPKLEEKITTDKRLFRKHTGTLKV